MTNNHLDCRELLSKTKFYESYSRWIEEENRYESWNDSVERVMKMHDKKYENLPEENRKALESHLNFAKKLYKEKRVLGAQRALQFGGDQLLKHQMKIFNCVSTYVDRPEVFGEFMYAELCGCGVGISLQKHHVANLPEIKERKKQAKTYMIDDSIEGWASAVDVLMSSFFVGGGKHPEFEGKRVYFDLSQIREKGSYISGGFKAPGPEPLRKALDKIEHLLQGLVLKHGKTKLDPIHAYDILMFEADAVISGGVRRSATIAMFSSDDEEMTNAKTGNWFFENPQRGRSNNSAILLRDSTSFEDFAKLVKSTREFGEPGFIWTDSTEFTFNPCVEVGKYPVWIDEDGNKHSGIQGCNLTEINGMFCQTEENFYEACKAASILGTLQAGYTDFQFVSDITRKIFERESLLGVSITGWMNSPKILLDEEVMRRGAKIVKETNEEIAKLLKINPAARTTCVKPSGNASTLLMSAPSVQGEHAKRYFRAMQINKEQEVAKLFYNKNPYMVEESVWSSTKSDYILFFPIHANEDSILKENLYDLELLKIVKKIQDVWVEEGTNTQYCVDSRVRHNVSNTINVRDNEDSWNEVTKYIYENRNSFAGISLLGVMGDKDYEQAPYCEVLTSSEIVEKYGDASLFASGLIVDSLKGFNSLWEACRIATWGDMNEGGEKKDIRKNWIERFEKFSQTFFEGDNKKAEYCLKDVHLLHKWNKIKNHYVNINFDEELTMKQFVDIDIMGAQACSSGDCDFQFA